MRHVGCFCPKCLQGKLPLIEVVELPLLPTPGQLAWIDACRRRAERLCPLVSPLAKKAVNPASDVGVFCNGSMSAPIDKGGSISGVK